MEPVTMALVITFLLFRRGGENVMWAFRKDGTDPPSFRRWQERQKRRGTRGSITGRAEGRKFWANVWHDAHESAHEWQQRRHGRAVENRRKRWQEQDVERQRQQALAPCVFCGAGQGENCATDCPERQAHDTNRANRDRGTVPPVDASTEPNRATDRAAEPSQSDATKPGDRATTTGAPSQEPVPANHATKPGQAATQPTKPAPDSEPPRFSLFKSDQHELEFKERHLREMKKAFEKIRGECTDDDVAEHKASRRRIEGDIAYLRRKLGVESPDPEPVKSLAPGYASHIDYLRNDKSYKELIQAKDQLYSEGRCTAQISEKVLCGAPRAEGDPAMCATCRSGKHVPRVCGKCGSTNVEYTHLRSQTGWVCRECFQAPDDETLTDTHPVKVNQGSPVGDDTAGAQVIPLTRQPSSDRTTASPNGTTTGGNVTGNTATGEITGYEATLTEHDQTIAHLESVHADADSKVHAFEQLDAVYENRINALRAANADEETIGTQVAAREANETQISAAKAALEAASVHLEAETTARARWVSGIGAMKETADATGAEGDRVLRS